MVKEVNLIEHLPPFVQTYREIKHLMSTENPEFQLICNESEKIKNNQFIQSCDSDGIKRFEKMLKIIPSDSETLPLRISRVLAKWNDVVPYTWKALIDKLDIICGVGNYILELNTNEYKITVSLALPVKYSLNIITSTIADMLPANMICECKMLYNTHKVLMEYPHYILAQFTHQELKDEVITLPGVIWEKWQCSIVKEEVHSGYTQTSENVGDITTDSLNLDSIIYADYSFWEHGGFEGEGSMYTAGNNEGKITDWIVGYYIVYETEVYKILSLDTENGDVTCEIVDACDVETVEETTYHQGSTMYGTYEAENGELPENGELIEGSADESHCVLKINGTYYYYIKSTEN